MIALNLHAQLYEVPLKEKTEKADLIIEGKVVDSQSYRGIDGEIYTAHKIEVFKSFKGNLTSNFVSAITLGGWVDDEIRSWTHLLTLEIGEAGVFFLSATRRPVSNLPNFPNTQFEVYSSSQGFLKYAFDEREKVAAAPFCVYSNVEEELFGYFEKAYGSAISFSKPQWENGNFRGGEEDCIVYKFDVANIVPVSEGYELVADVMVKVTSGEYYLSQSAIVATYDSEMLGDSIIQNSILEVESVGISSESNYEIVATELASDKVEIKVKAINLDALSLVELTDDFTLLTKLKLTLSEIADPGIFLDNNVMEENTEFYNSVTQRPETFRCLQIEGDFEVACSPPVITSFSPAPPMSIRAGTDDTLTIRGMCFDTIRGTSEVEFTDSKAGAPPVTWVQPLDGEYIVWSDTLIKVIVPSIVKGMDISQSAGTGRFRVNRGAAGTATSPLDLNITFAALNFGTGPFSKPKNKGISISLSNYNMLGGQSIYYASSFKASTNAVKAFERALINWRCATLVNYKVQDSTSVPDISRAGRIEFANLPVGVTTTLASTDNIPYTPCIAVDSVVRANRREFVIKFNENLMWHTDTLMPTPLPANTFDLESRALHELGHAHLLNHSNNPNDLMYFTDVTPPYRRVIMPNDEAGGNYIMSISTPPAPTGCQTEMTAVNPANCGVTNVIEIEKGVEISIDVFPNPTTDELNITIYSDLHFRHPSNLRASIFNILGRKVSEIQLTEATSSFSLSEFSSGLYILSVSYEEKPIRSFKIQKQ